MIVVFHSKKDDAILEKIYAQIAYWELENTVHLLIEQSKSGLEAWGVLSKLLYQASSPKKNLADFLVQYFLDQNSEIDLHNLENCSVKEQKDLIFKASLFLNILINFLF